ncbi:MAG: hypothetical protein V3W44_04350 [Dehalococcoidales bacterium]
MRKIGKFVAKKWGLCENAGANQYKAHRLLRSVRRAMLEKGVTPVDFNFVSVEALADDWNDEGIVMLCRIIVHFYVYKPYGVCIDELTTHSVVILQRLLFASAPRSFQEDLDGGNYGQDRWMWPGLNQIDIKEWMERQRALGIREPITTAF